MGEYWKKCEICGMEGDNHYFFNGKVLCYVCRNKALKKQDLGVDEIAGP